MSPSRSPRRELETNWGNLVKVAGEIRRHEAIILSGEEPPKAVSRSADIAARAFRKDGRVWLLAVNKTTSPVKGAVSVEGFADVTFELPALGVKTHRFDSVNYDEGKAALLAAARDERFAVCVPNQTGKGGVPLGKRDFGENVFREVEMFPHWFCKAYRKYADREKSMAFDQHLLLACVAPRALLVQGFDRPWFDPRGEWLSCRAASPAWTFLGKPGLPDVPEPDCFSTAAVGPSLGYVRRKGQHGISGHDWQWMLDFADRILGK